MTPSEIMAAQKAAEDAYERDYQDWLVWKKNYKGD